MNIDIEYLNDLKLNRVNKNIYGEILSKVPIKRVIGITYNGNDLICIVGSKLIQVPLGEIEIESEVVETEKVVEAVEKVN